MITSTQEQQPMEAAVRGQLYAFIWGLFYPPPLQDWSLWLWETRRFWAVWGDDERVPGCPRQKVQEVVQAPPGQTQRWEELDRCKINERLKHWLYSSVHLRRHLRVWLWKSVVTVKRYVRKGVPNEHRARIWMVASGAQEQLESKPGYYRSLLEMEHDAKLKETIHTGMIKLSPHLGLQKNSIFSSKTISNFILLIYFCCGGADMHRTFPDNILFKSRAEEGLQKALFNVLLAYGHHNQSVGYCQVEERFYSSFASLHIWFSVKQKQLNEAITMYSNKDVIKVKFSLNCLELWTGECSGLKNINKNKIELEHSLMTNC